MNKETPNFSGKKKSSNEEITEKMELSSNSVDLIQSGGQLHQSVIETKSESKSEKQKNQRSIKNPNPGNQNLKFIFGQKTSTL